MKESDAENLASHCGLEPYAGAPAMWMGAELWSLDSVNYYL
jgi:hypothetical protein